ncbi:hypothetical protein IFM61606_06859 [Aspergillus udagawae]|nr:hypothetical protein IFM5058_06378 [Aspergillus udagawae]GFG26856.1 hypothetical protein IFM61606_06859 [Aspergillus udagawae]
MARALFIKQSNTVGFLLDSYDEQQKAGANVTIADEKGETPLHACAEFERYRKRPPDNCSHFTKGVWHFLTDDDEILR